MLRLYAIRYDQLTRSEGEQEKTCANNQKSNLFYCGLAARFQRRVSLIPALVAANYLGYCP
jgi:hypothetical protein